jgi:hypothetical protein
LPSACSSGIQCFAHLAVILPACPKKITVFIVSSSPQQPNLSNPFPRAGFAARLLDSLARDDDPVGRGRVLPQRRGAVSPWEEQREVRILSYKFVFRLAIDLCGADWWRFAPQGRGGAAIGGEDWQLEGFGWVD